MPSSNDPGSSSPSAPFERLDRSLEHRTRLAICVMLSHGTCSFRRLKDLTGESDGALGTHLATLEQTGYVTSRKEFAARRPVTWYSLAPPGRSALRRHLDALREIVDQAAVSSSAKRSASGRTAPKHS